MSNIVDRERTQYPVLVAPPKPKNNTITVNQTGHGFAVGSVLKCTGTNTYALAKADTTSNAQVVGVVAAVITANVFVMTTGGLLTGLSGKTAGTRYYLSSSSAGGVTSTAPSIAVTVYDAISASAAMVNIDANSPATLPTEDGTVWCSKSDLTGGEWVRDVDIGQNVSAKAGTLRVKSPNASGDAVVIDGSLITASTKKIYIQQVFICDTGTGTVKSAMTLISDSF